MKKKLLFLSLCVLSCLFGISVYAQDYPQDLLVDNFNDADLTLANWDGAVGASGWNTEWSATEGRNGSGCIKILTGQGGFWNTALGPWPVGHKFKISCWVKGSTANSANVIFDIQGVLNGPTFACVDQNGAKGRWDTCTVVPITTEWQLQEATFVTQARTDAPAFNITVDCNKTLYSCVGWDNPDAEGYSLVDDFKIIDLGPAVPDVQGEVLLVDDFNDADLTLANWDGAVGASGWNTEWSANEGRNGSGCIKILEGQGGFWNTALGPWPVGHKFKVSCWVKGSTTNSANVIFDIQGVLNAPTFACVDQNGAKGRWDTCTVVPITTDWQLQEATFVTQARTDPPAFNITVDCNKTLYSCVGWDNPDAEGYSLVDDFRITDLGAVTPTGVITLQSQPLIYISDDKLRNVNGLVSVYDIMGRLVIKSFAYEGTLNVASLKRGIYIVHANNSAVKIVR